MTGFRALDFAILRLSARPSGEETHPDGPVAVPEFLRQVAEDSFVREAIEVSSPALAAALEKIRSGALTDPARCRRVARSINRYLTRMTRRPTPFGLLAGVAAAQFDDQPKIRIGTGHRRHVRVDTSWLTEVIRPLETDPAILARLRVVRNDLGFRRGDRLVLPLVPQESGVRGPDDRERTVRCTAPVRAALEAAHTPVTFPMLLARLGEQFPQAGEDVLTKLLTQLVEMDFLVTDVRPPATTEDPIAHVLTRVGPTANLAAELARVREEINRYAAGGGHEALRAVTATMRGIHDQDQLLQVDLGMDADLVLPTAVADELASAAEIAWRVAPPRLAPADPLATYRMDFIDRYGIGTVVPAKEMLDPERGIGPPAGYLLPPGNRSAAAKPSGESERDTTLLGVAMRGGREVLLDNDIIDRLSQTDREGSYAEICVQLLADSEDSLRRGEFRLVGSGDVNFTRVGALFGRFLPVVPQLRDKISAVAAELVAASEATLAQLITPPLHPRMANVTRVPVMTDTAVTVGGFAEHQYQLGLDDLGVTATFDRFAVVSLRDGTEIAPFVFHSLNPKLAVPNVVRLLIEIGESHTPSWPLWHWGAAADLPYLPRIRHGRTILSPARWLPDPRLRDDLDRDEWLRLFDRWRADWSVPSIVHATTPGDRQTRLDLGSPAAVELLRADLRKNPRLVVREEPAGGEFGSGWAHGHAAEVVVPVVPLRSRTKPVAASRPFVSRSYPPGGEWLYLKVYADRGRHTELLTRHLPELVARAQPVSDRWFFLRYADPGHHLRIRFHGDPDALTDELLPTVHKWTGELIKAGLIAELAIGTYRPEVSRYGGPSAIEAAERAFHADSQCVLEQLSLREQGRLELPMDLLLAANHIDLARRLRGDDTWLLTTFPKDQHHKAFQRCRREAVQLLGQTALPGELVESWQRRAPLLLDYARAVQDGDGRAGAFASILHVHHNRLSGTGLDEERDAYAIARGVVQARQDRERQERR